MRDLLIAAALGAQSAFAGHYMDSLNRVHLKMNENNRFKVL